MRSFTKTILAAVLFLVSSGLASAAPTLNVHIQDELGAPVPFVTVAAIEFGMNGPSTYTQVGLTNGSGDASFTLSSGTYGRSYNLYYSSHGFSPSISDQFNNPEYDPNRYVWAMGDTAYFSTFTITQNLTEVGIIRQEFTHATPNKVLFGGVWNMKSQMQGGSGIVVVDVSSNGVLAVDNVPYADANTYNIGLYDPAQNQGIGRNVMTALNAGTPVISYTGSAKLDFEKAVPPARVADEPSKGTGETASGASVEGVMMSTGGVAIPWMGIEIKACQGYEWRNWAHVGEDGRFKLYGLTPGTTYYVSAHGGCTWSHENQESKCFEPYASPNFNVGDICSGSVDHSIVTANDIVYISSDVLFHRVVLNEMPKSIGQIKVYVKSSNGFNMPNANVSVNPDGSPWPTDPLSCSNEQNYMQYFSTNFINSPGLSNQNINTSATGYALLDGLPSGNYMINVWTPFSQNNSNGPSGFNAGDDGEFGFGNNGCGQGCNWSAQHCQGKGRDDYRITITTWTTPTFHVYNSSGVDVGLSSITYIVEAGGVNLNGLVRGTVRFPGITDLSATPIMITLYPQCDNQGPCGAFGNFTAIDGSGAASYDYSINVSTGYSYYMQVKAIGWGRVKNGGGDDRINLTSTGTAVVDMNFTPAGSVSGTLYKPGPNGVGKVVVTPSANQWIWVGVNSERGWSGAQLQKDGTFEMTDVIPGLNRMYINISGGGNSNSEFNYAMPSPTPVVNVIAGSTMSVDVNLVDATLVGATLDITKVPDPTILKRSSNSWDTALGFKVVPVPAGTVLKAETIGKLFFGKGGDEGSQMRYSDPTGPNQEGPCGRSWPGGFCASRMPSPSTYDFYLMRFGDFGDSKSSGTVTGLPWPHYVLLTSSKNVIVDAAHATGLVSAGNGSTTPVSGVSVNLTPATNLSGRGNATLAGSVTADNFFRQPDYDALGGDFEKFMDYLPMTMLYDSNGAFKAAGIVVPPMEWIRQNEEAIDLAFAQGYPQLKAMFDTAPYWGFEIRGLKPLDCFTAVVTTPNYPPYQTKTCVGANTSTTTITVDLDSAVGSGATVSGVVTSTATPAVKLANALVELIGEGVDKSAVTNSSGAYVFEGLPRGTVRLKVSAEGYAQADTEQDLVGSNSYTQNFALTAAGGSITGTVYTQKVPYAKVQSGAQIVAYNDTFNGNTTGATAMIRTLTGSDGTYKLTGLVPGDVYKLFLKVPGKYTLSLTTTAINGNIPDMDFITKAKSFDLEMSVAKTESAFEFTVKNPGDFKTGEARYNTSPYSVTGSTVLAMEKNPATGDLIGKIPLTDLANGITYVLHAAATSYSNKFIEKELQFGKAFKGSAQQHIDEYILGDQSTGDNAAPLVGSEDPSAIVFPPGAVQATGVPTCSSKGEDKDDAAVADKVAALGAEAFAGDLYTVQLTSVSVNDGKSIELSLAYDKNLVDEADVNSLTVARYNDSTGDWEQVTGLATPNKDQGTIKVKLRTLASVLSVKKGAVSPQFNRFDGRQYHIRPQAVGAGGSGTFAVVNSAIAGNAFSGSKMKVFNYPNPFNLKNKAISNNNGAALPGTTNGTVIHVEVPAGNGGPGHVRIYTLAGELVKDIKVDFTAGAYNYVAWDGHNSGGQEVANGVYYGVVEMTGKKPKLKDATFKMAVIK